MKKLIVLVLPLLLAVVSVRADVIWYEGFQYSNGSLTNSGAWTKFSGTANPSDMFVNNSNCEVAATGGVPVSRQDDLYRRIALAAGSPYTNAPQVLYASFTVICTNLPNAAGSWFASFYSTANGYFGRVQAFTNSTIVPNTWRLGATANSLATNAPNGGYPVDLALNTPYQVVEELDPVTLFAATIWVNPINLDQTGSSPTETHYTTSDSMGNAVSSAVNAYAFRQASSFGNAFFRITNLVLTTSFAEAVTNIWSTNAVPPTIVIQPTAVASNFPSSTVILSAAANGQGLGELTYKWQKSATSDNANPSDYSNPNGNSNVLPFNNAQTGDSGYYTMIATTPYGLSVTSSIAKVAIVDGAYPPVFTVQPVKKTIFSGQSATLTTTVLGPPSGGTPVFTWYSNNVVVTAGQTDNGYSSTYAINNATTAVPVTNNFKVAVTNSYGGIISSNAAVTVNPVPVVSIAYLRTLVDPNNNYQSTNSTLPYQTTGVITTYTNLTTGNTASYYLQDGTAGINIFATFGSTFRPAQGDVVTFVGVMSSFSSGLELFADPTTLTYTSYTSSGPGTLPAPMSIPFTITNTGYANMNTNIAGRLVRLTGAYFGTNAGTTITAPSVGVLFVTVTNSSGQPFDLAFTSQSLDTQGQTLPTYASTVTGVMFGGMNGGNPNFSIMVTKFSDIVAASIPPPSIPLSMVYSGGTLTFTWTDPSFSLQSSTNINGPYIDIPGATTGFMTNTTSGATVFFRLYHTP